MMIIRPIVATAITAVCLTFAGALPTHAQSEDAAPNKGMIEYNNACRTCHSWKEGDNRLGPNLHNIVGRKAAAAEGFAYSPALRNAKFDWTEENLDKFLADPEGFLPGNNMKPFTRIGDAESRKTIIEFLKSPE